MTTDPKALVAELRREADEAGPGLVIAPWIVIQAADAIEQLQRRRDDAIHGCHRSHPHENMGNTCERFTEYETEAASLRSQLHSTQQSLEAMHTRAEKAESALAAATAGREGRDMDAEAFQYLQNAPRVEAQAFFWQYVSRSQRRKAILEVAALTKAKGAT